jgi:hypothetical protein
MEESRHSDDWLPNICGSECSVGEAIRAARDHPALVSERTVGGRSFDDLQSAFAVALHMHQPLIPAGGADLRSASLVSNLQHMQNSHDTQDTHNAAMFRCCYRRMADLVPRLVDEGMAPRVMLDYSGTLLCGLERMGAHDVLDGLRRITTDSPYRDAVEWLGCPWGHAVAPSTPVQDYRLHVRAWQHHFAAIFGLQALGRVHGFSPAEMALPNHPDVAYEFAKTLTDCGYRWVLVQEDTVELPDGRHVERPHLPHRLVCRGSGGQTASITALIKTRGSDSKLVGQMQPYYEARGLGRIQVAGHSVPPLVSQIADGENGGVMMNEFPPKYVEVIRECSGSPTPILNGTEYLQSLYAAGVRADDLPVIQPVFQHRIWQRMTPGDGSERMAEVIAQLRGENDRFHVEGGSWTNNTSWVRGYEQVLVPMDRASSDFHERLLVPGVATDDPRYRNALFHLLTSQTSCYRYWGRGRWTAYGTELARRTSDIVTHDG